MCWHFHSSMKPQECYFENMLLTMLYFIRWMPVVQWLLFSLPAWLTTVTEFCTLSRRKSFIGCRWFWTPLSVWSSVLASFNTSRQFIMMCFTGCQYQCVSGYMVTAFDCIGGTGPAYFKDVCMPVTDNAYPAHLRSADGHDTYVPYTKHFFGLHISWTSIHAHVGRRPITYWVGGVVSSAAGPGQSLGRRKVSEHCKHRGWPMCEQNT